MGPSIQIKDWKIYFRVLQWWKLLSLAIKSHFKEDWLLTVYSRPKVEVLKEKGTKRKLALSFFYPLVWEKEIYGDTLNHAIGLPSEDREHICFLLVALSLILSKIHFGNRSYLIVVYVQGCCSVYLFSFDYGVNGMSLEVRNKVHKIEWSTNPTDDLYVLYIFR